jgi:predicted RNA-binding protein with PUA-like domain
MIQRRRDPERQVGGQSASGVPATPPARRISHRTPYHHLAGAGEAQVTSASMSTSKWLLKSEPGTFSFEDLVRDRRTSWEGVRNYQARNSLRAMRRGDLAVFYHSNATPPGAAGICKVVKTAEPDPTQFDPASQYFDPTARPDDPRWDWVTVAPVRPLQFVPLPELRAMPELSNCQLLAKGSRLSVLPLTDAEFDAITRRGRRLPTRPPRP